MSETKCDKKSPFPESVNVVSKEGDMFAVPGKLAAMSELLQTMMYDKREDEDEDEVQVLPAPNVDSATLAKVFTFLNLCDVNGPMRAIKKPLRSENIGELVDPWAAEFVAGLDKEMLFKLTNAAVYLDIISLINLCCAKIASMFKGKSEEQILTTFEITNTVNQKTCKDGST
tara:strand:+ start:50 stop:565 length:516 start_codon:yes stop_codon:yes gene_type:complete